MIPRAAGLLLVMVLGPGSALAQGFRPGGIEPQGPTAGPTIEELAEWAGPDGDTDRARDGILTRLQARPAGAEATLWVGLLGMIDDVEPPVAAAAVRAVGLLEEGRGEEGADLVMDELSGATEEIAPALLAFAAHLADPNDGRKAAEIRGRLLESYPDAREAPEATILRARWLLQSEDLKAEGMHLLEQFIIDRPEHPLAPEARRLFETNGGRS